MEQTCTTSAGADFACGKWATRQVRERFDGQSAVCTSRDVDRYGRFVAKCTVGKEDMGEVIVSEGWAFANRRYGLDYDLAEKSAFVAGRGLHQVKVQSPARFRASNAKVATNLAGDCKIKGNISKSGRIFHVPGQKHYAKTRIDPRRGERWFCSVEDAHAAGWRSARQ